MSSFLVGKTINEIKIAEDKQAILFLCNDGEHIARADADCCSSTWIESIEAPALGFPCLVIEMRELDMPQPRERDECGGVIQFYGLNIKTNKGDIVIDYRNSSNGYYGGNLSFPDEDFYGGVFNQNVSDQEWRDVDFIGD